MLLQLVPKVEADQAELADQMEQEGEDSLKQFLQEEVLEGEEVLEEEELLVEEEADAVEAVEEEVEAVAEAVAEVAVVEIK